MRPLLFAFALRLVVLLQHCIAASFLILFQLNGKIPLSQHFSNVANHATVSGKFFSIAIARFYMRCLFVPFLER